MERRKVFEFESDGVGMRVPPLVWNEKHRGDYFDRIRQDALPEPVEVW
jgi:hypothetical protein